MAAGPVLTGDEGRLIKEAGATDTEIEIGAWTCTLEAQSDRYASSKSGGYLLTENGNKGATGSFEGKRATDTKVEDEVAPSNTVVTLYLIFTTTGPSGMTMPCKIKTLTFNVNPNTGEVQSYSCTFESHGAYDFSPSYSL